MKVYKKVEQYIECDLAIASATLLSIEEAKELSPELRKYERWWWLWSPGDASLGAAGVDYDGSVYDLGYIVYNSRDAVRPALQISNLQSSNLQIGDVFTFGGKPFQIISDNLAFCLSDIGTCAFREDWKVANANDYETSDVKKFVDEWFNEAIKNDG